jgi:tRNA A-37 threonylcarbamoyl transferase component Bud32
MMKCSKIGVKTPYLYRVDVQTARIYMEFIQGLTVKEYIVQLFKEQEINTGKI